MPRTSRLASFVVAALLVVVASVSLRAIGPSIIMFYGGDLKEPVIVYPGNPSYNPTSFIWSPSGNANYYTGQRGAVPPNLEGRRYVSIAIFWGPSDGTGLKPSDASQHGRFYLPTETAPGALVITTPNMASAGGGPPKPVPVPTKLDEFFAGRTLTPSGAAELKVFASIP